jgi:tetratricopeptide (TPR) repeat protein
MFKRFWLWLKRWFRRLFKTFSQSSLRMVRKENAPSNPVESPKRLTDAEYESLFIKLLEGVHQGWSQGLMQGFLISQNISEAELVKWLHGFGERVLASSAVNDELALLLVRLGEVASGELEQVARSIGRQLLGKGKDVDSQDVDEDLGSQNAKKWFDRGFELLESGKYEEALTCFDKVLEIQPDDYKAWTNRGLALDKLERYEESLISYDRALEYKLDCYLAWGSRGIVLRKLGRSEEVITSYERALQYKPNYYETWHNLGNELYTSGQYEEAIKSYNQALQHKPDNYLAWCIRGDALRKLGNYEEAITSYDRALQYKSDYLGAWNNRGLTLEKLGNYEEAIVSYDRILEIKPDLYQAWGNRGSALSDLGKYEEAIASYERALEIQPDLYQAWYNRGITLGNLGKYEEAIASYERALEIQPDYYEAWDNRGSALSNLGRYEEAITSYNRILHYKPDDLKAWIRRGVVLCDFLGQYQEAIISFEKALKIRPDDYEAWGNKGVALDKLERYEEAIASYDNFLYYQPYDYKAWNGRGNAAGNSRNLDFFLASLSHIAKQHPELNKRGYEGKLASYREGLKYIHQDTYPEGWGLLHQYIGKAHYFHWKNRQRKNSQYWRDAIQEYNEAYKTLKDFPERHLELLRDFIRAYLDAGKQEQAEELQRRAWDLFQNLVKKQPSPCEKSQLSLKYAWLEQLTVDLSLQKGELVKAWHLAEKGKNACLTWLLIGWQEETEIDSPDYPQIQQFLAPATAIVYWHISPNSLNTFILKHGAEAPILVTPPVSTEEERCPEPLERLSQFEDWLKRWNRQYNEYRSKGKESQHSWRTEMGQQLVSLSNILNIQEIERHLTGIEQLILVPHQDLHRFPLHALFSEKFEITYLPSLQMGLSLQKVQRDEAAKPSLLSVEAPDSEGLSPLNFAILESEIICQLFSDSTRLQGETATKEQVATELANSYNAFHFAGHGLYNFHDPKSSELALASTERLTLAEIRQYNLSHYQLVTLSACETAITGNQTITTEYVGLVSGFLSQGVPHVVSTLWTVESAASALVMIEFYRRWQAGLSEVKALAEATIWLRNLTVAQLKAWYESWREQLPQDETKICAFIKTELYKINKMEMSKMLYEHPYYWAAFIITGSI